MPDQLGTPPEVAEHLQTDERTLANWRSLGIGPPYMKVGGKVRYDWADIRAWLVARRRVPVDSGRI